MDLAFEEANVRGYKSLIEGLTLPDKDDRHVLAVGIKSEASVIITFNKKDFPAKSVKPFSINIQDPTNLWAICSSRTYQKFWRHFINW